MLDIFLWYSLQSHFWFFLLHFRFFNFCQNLEILSIHLSGTACKIWCFYLYKIWRYNALNIHHTVTRTNTHTEATFWIRETLKHVNQVKTRHGKFWAKATFLPNGSRVMEVKMNSRYLKKYKYENTLHSNFFMITIFTYMGGGSAIKAVTKTMNNFFPLNNSKRLWFKLY